MISEKTFKLLDLSKELSLRDIKSRYKGSVLGWIWTFITPLAMLTVYTFIFGFVFKSRWADDDLSNYDFAMNLFIGMLFFSFFSECFSRASSIIYTNSNYVKKIVFRTEILPFVNLISALFHFFTGLFIWFLAMLFISDSKLGVYSIISLILIVIAFSMMTLGISYYLSAFGTYIKDLNQICNSFIALILFISPVFYNSSILPDSISKFILLNPISYPILESRNVLINGDLLDISGYLVYFAIATFILISGYFLFIRLKKGFADVV